MNRKDLLLIRLEAIGFRKSVIDKVQQDYTENDLSGITIDEFILQVIIKNNYIDRESDLLNELIAIGYNWNTATKLETHFIENINRNCRDVVEYSLENEY